MDHRSVVLTVIRLAGLGIIIAGVTTAATNLGSYFSDPESFNSVGLGWLMLALLVSIVVPMAIGLMLIAFAREVGQRVLRIEVEPATDDGRSAQLQHIAFSTVGLWLISYAFLDAVYFIAKTRLYQRLVEGQVMSFNTQPLLPEEFAGFVTAGTQFVLGLLLLFGGKGLANALSRVRSSGKTEP